MPHRNAFAKAAFMEWHRTHLQPILNTLMGEYLQSLRMPSESPAAGRANCHECTQRATEAATAAATTSGFSHAEHALSHTATAQEPQTVTPGQAQTAPTPTPTASANTPTPTAAAAGTGAPQSHTNGCTHASVLVEELSSAQTDFTLLRNLYLGEVPTDRAARLRVGMLLCTGSLSVGDPEGEGDDGDEGDESGMELDEDEENADNFDNENDVGGGAGEPSPMAA